MLIHDFKNKTLPFDNYKDLRLEREINKLDILTFLVPAESIKYFKNEYIIETENQFYVIKNIEPSYNNYIIECKQDISDWYIFNESLNFPYKPIQDVLEGIKPNDWQIVIQDDIKQKRTITADQKMSSEVVDELIEKYDIEYRYDNKNKKLYIGFEMAGDNGVYFTKSLNLIDKDIKTESFEFATRIVPEGMNGLRISQINGGKDYLENNSYSPKTITYYWKDERYTNIQNLKEAAQRKLDVLSKPYRSIETTVQDLSRALGVEHLDFQLGDFVYLLDEDEQTQEFYRIIKIKSYNANPFETEVTLNNKPLDLVDDERDMGERMIELTSEMWEKTRVRFETTDDAIKGFVETQKRYTDDSFKTYKSEREQTDQRIYEAITESTTYVDPETGQTKPIIDKQLEIDKSLEGIKIDLVDVAKTNEKNIAVSFDKIQEQMDRGFSQLEGNVSTMQGDLLAYKQSFDIANGEVNSEITALRDEIDKTDEGIKRYLRENYSSREQTDQMIADRVGSIRQQIGQSEDDVKKYVEENYSTKSQTSTAIQSEVRSIKSDATTAKAQAKRATDIADVAHSQAIQTANEISTKVGEKDVYSLIQQMPSYVKIDAKNINMTGDVDIVGKFRTSSYGKRVRIEGTSIYFEDGSRSMGELTIKNDSLVLRPSVYGSTWLQIGGKNGVDNSYRNINAPSSECGLVGSWAITNVNAIATMSMYSEVDRLLTVHERSKFKGRAEFKSRISLENGFEINDGATVGMSSSGNQFFIDKNGIGKRFVIDLREGKTFFV